MKITKHIYKNFDNYNGEMSYFLSGQRSALMEKDGDWIHVKEITFSDNVDNDAEKALAAIDRQEEELRAKFQDGMARINESRAKYMALEQLAGEGAE